jgi:sortase (surface protein transpeptidase)
MLSVLPWIFSVLILAAIWLVAPSVLNRVGPVTTPPEAMSQDAQGVAVAAPVRIRIPALGIDAPIVNLGLNANKTLQVPKGDFEVGWYTGSPKPGAIGPSVMVGHLDSVRGPAIFQNLSRLKAGDIIEIVRKDGSKATFQVDTQEKYSQNKFPTEKVYGSIDYPGLRLITCAGTYSRLKGRYSDNLVIYASLKK